MAAIDLEIVDGKAAGSWIGPELSQQFGSVAGVVPPCLDSYARILHPARDAAGNSITWTEVATQTGREVHRLAQWESLVGTEHYEGPGTLWSGAAPDTGDLDNPLLTELCDLLARHTSDPASCFFGIWGSNFEESFVQSEVPAAQRLELPGRDYTVIAGPLSAAGEMVGVASMFSPQLIWPADRAWFVGTEIDFDSTLVGGSDRLVEDIMDSPKLEAWQVEPGDSLTYDADRLNPPAPWRGNRPTADG